MAHRIEKQAEQLIIKQRDKEVTKKIREAFQLKHKALEEKQLKRRKWYEFWKIKKIL